jgi:putative membrane protein
MSRDTIWSALTRWRGILLATVALVATVWLAITNQLILYINPRYVVFTVIMAVIALALVIASFARRPHSHDDPPTRIQKVLTVAAGVLTLAIAALMIVVPPATLSSSTAIQRDINSPTVDTQTQTVSHASSASAAAFAKFTVLDWSSLLRQTTDASFYQDKTADVVGFVTPDTEDPANVFFVSRFVITCCAVDAQPVGVPVYLPNWKQKYASDKWVRVTGGFTADPSRKSSQQIALIPSKVTVVAKPSQPYLF